MSTDTPDIIPVVSAVARYAANLGRALTTVEQAAVIDAELDCARKDALHAAWLARLGDKERARFGMEERFTP